ncbi:hypothetical protein ACSBR1_030184 [Camellia fascicularis]
MFAMERWCSLSCSISGGRGHKSLGRDGMARGSYGEGNNLHRFCKGNDLAAAISVGVTTVVLRRELLLHRVVGTLLQLAKPVEETYASISRKCG